MSTYLSKENILINVFFISLKSYAFLKSTGLLKNYPFIFKFKKYLDISLMNNLLYIKVDINPKIDKIRDIKPPI